MLVSRDLYKKSSKTQKIRCEICANYCKIADGNVGVCKQHKNINGELFDESYGIVSSLSPDPIEKKPLNHFLPGTLTYSIGGFGCNMTCLHCQNYMISQEYDKNSRGIKITPEAIVENALNYNCKSIAWTYNEPTIHLPFSKKTSLLARQKKPESHLCKQRLLFRQVTWGSLDICRCIQYRCQINVSGFL